MLCARSQFANSVSESAESKLSRARFKEPMAATACTYAFCELGDASTDVALGVAVVDGAIGGGADENKVGEEGPKIKEWTTEAMSMTECISEKVPRIFSHNCPLASGIAYRRAAARQFTTADNVRGANVKVGPLGWGWSI